MTLYEHSSGENEFEVNGLQLDVYEDYFIVALNHNL